MLQCMIVNSIVSTDLARMVKKAALEGQDLPRMYLAHHELESLTIIINFYYYCRHSAFAQTR